MLQTKDQISSLYNSLTLWEKISLYENEINRAKKQWFGFLRLALYKRILKRLSRFHRFIEQDLELKIKNLQESKQFWEKNTDQATVEKADLLNTIDITLAQTQDLQRQFIQLISPKTKNNLAQLEHFFEDFKNLK